MLNPFTYLASAAGKVVADGWTAAMLGLWNAGLWLLKLVLGIVDAFTTPDLREGGPGGSGLPDDVLDRAGALMLAPDDGPARDLPPFRRDGQSWRGSWSAPASS